jgi:hypothetical protein
MENNLMVNINLDKNGIQVLLRQGVVNVKFIKKNGSKRNMNCTLMEKVLKHYYPDFQTLYHATYEKRTVDAEKSIKVLDTDLGEFRTINLNTIESIDFSTQTAEEVIKPATRSLRLCIELEVNNCIDDDTIVNNIKTLYCGSTTQVKVVDVYYY